MIETQASDGVRGKVLFDVNDKELAMFDEFEGDEYYKKSIQADLGNEDRFGSSAVSAQVYIWQDSGRPLLYGTWSYEEFREKHLEEYVKMVTAFSRELWDLI